jgi:Mn-dependent DtxR family transcriptional regulator
MKRVYYYNKLIVLHLTERDKKYYEILKQSVDGQGYTTLTEFSKVIGKVLSATHELLFKFIELGLVEHIDGREYKLVNVPNTCPLCGHKS